MELKKAFWDGSRWHEAGEACPKEQEKKAKLQGALKGAASDGNKDQKS